jgi:hypothetical protein
MAETVSECDCLGTYGRETEVEKQILRLRRRMTTESKAEKDDKLESQATMAKTIDKEATMVSKMINKEIKGDGRGRLC